MSRVDRAFRRFQRTGDPDALAFVFDRVAPELARLAAHLAPHAAEDLVQDTFLFAIERVASFEPRGSVLPWLVGVLAHKARAARRLSRRTPDPERLPPAGVHDPEGEAAEGEVHAELREAIDALPEPYRGVLGPQLREGLGPDEIAQRLGRNPSTVRTQLSRGLERLRATLPRGLGAVAVTVPPGLERAREVVLRAVPARPVVHTASSFGVVAVALLVVGGVAWAWGGPGMPAVVVSAGVPVGAAELVPDEAIERQRSPGREPDAPLAEATVVPVALPVTILGRCVAIEGEAPLAGVSVRARDRASKRDLAWVRYGGSSATPPDPVTTAADGTFRIQVESQPSARWVIATEIAGYAQTRIEVSGRELGDHAEEGMDVGDLRLRRGVPLTGRVVDEQGAPVEGVAGSVWVAAQELRGEHSFVHFKSGTDGHWAVLRNELVPRVRLPFVWWERPGTVAVEPQWQVLGPPEFLEPGEQEARLDLVVRVAPRVRGRVLDTDGAPVAQVRVNVVTVGASGQPSQGVTGISGTFSAWSHVAPGTPVSIRAEPSPGIEIVGEPVASTWGGSEVELRVRRVAAAPRGVVELTVVDAVTGTPIDRYGVIVCRTVGTSTSMASGSYHGEHVDGRCRIDDQPAGLIELHVLPPLGYPRTSVEVDVPQSGVVARRVAIPREAVCALDVQVLGPDGLGLGMAEVEVIAPDSGVELQADDRVLPALGYGVGLKHRQLDTTRASRLGRCRLFAPQCPTPYVVRVRSPGQPTTLLRGVVCDAATRAVVVHVTTGAILTARLTPPGVAAMSLTLRLLTAGRPVALAHLGDSGNGFAFASDGTLRVAGLPRGSYTAQLVYQSKPMGPIRLPHVLRELGVVSLDAGQPCDLVIDAAEFAPGELRGRVVGATAPRPGESYMLLGRLAGQPSVLLNVGPFAAGADGTFTLPNVPPGRFRLRVNLGGVPHTSVEEVELPAGATVEQTFTLRRDG